MEEYKNNLESRSEQETGTDWDTLQKMNFEDRIDDVDKARAEAEAANKVYDDYSGYIDSLNKSAEWFGDDQDVHEKIVEHLDRAKESRDDDMEIAANEAGADYTNNTATDSENKNIDRIDDVDKARAEAEAANKVYDDYSGYIDSLNKSAEWFADDQGVHEKIVEDLDRAKESRDDEMEIAANEAGANYTNNTN